MADEAPNWGNKSTLQSRRGYRDGNVGRRNHERAPERASLEMRAQASRMQPCWVQQIVLRRARGSRACWCAPDSCTRLALVLTMLMMPTPTAPLCDAAVRNTACCCAAARHSMGRGAGAARCCTALSCWPKASACAVDSTNKANGDNANSAAV
jgi:hypothetical protein